MEKNKIVMTNETKAIARRNQSEHRLDSIFSHSHEQWLRDLFAKYEKSLDLVIYLFVCLNLLQNVYYFVVNRNLEIIISVSGAIKGSLLQVNKIISKVFT